MEYQAKLNKQQAFYSTGLAKDLWNYTNYGNTMRHIKGAGLSPGLIYGQSGAGGSTSGAGQASGVGQPNKTGTEVGLQAQGMALQLANVMSQTRLNESQAEKNKAESDFKFSIKAIDDENKKIREQIEIVFNVASYALILATCIVVLPESTHIYVFTQLGNVKLGTVFT